MTQGFNWEGTKQKYTYQLWLTNQSWKVGEDYAAQINWFELTLLSQLTVTTEKLRGKKNRTERGLKNKQKIITGRKKVDGRK